MGRKKKAQEVYKPFCYYCDRVFDDEKVLIEHQKARHFKCTQCSRKLNNARSLVIHLSKVHKETITKVPHALEGRDGLELNIEGVHGIPDDFATGDAAAPPAKAARVEIPATVLEQAASTSGTFPRPYPYPAPAMPPPGMPPLYGAPPPYGYPPQYMPPPYGYAPPMMPGGVPHYAAAPTAPGAPLAAVAPRGPTLSAAPTVASAAGAAAAVPGSLNAPPPQPLFPIGAPPPTAAASTPGYTTTPTPTPTAAAAAAVDTVCLIYGDDEVSMEERRASLGKYHKPVR